MGGGGWSRREQLLVGLILRMTLCPSGMLQSMHKENMHKVLKSGTPALVFATADPVLQGLSIRAVQLVFLVLGVLALAYGAGTAVSMNGVGSSEFQFLRYTNLETRNGTAGMDPGIATFGILQAFGRRQNACMGPTAGSTWEVQGPSLILSLPARAQAVGWYMVAPEEGAVPLGGMPSRFRVDGSNDLVGWEQVGSSEFLTLADRNVFLDGVREPPVLAGEYIHFDMRTPWPMRFGFNIVTIVYGGGVLCTAVVAMLGKVKRAKAIFFVTLFGTALASCVGAVGGHSFGLEYHASNFLLDAVLEGLVLGVGLLAFATWFDSIILMAGLLRFAKVCLLEADSLPHSKIVLVLPVIHSFFGLVFVIGRHVGAARALNLVRRDKARFEAAFSSLLSRPGTSSQLATIHEAIARLHESFPNSRKPPRQLHRKDNPMAAIGAMRQLRAKVSQISEFSSSLVARPSHRRSSPRNGNGVNRSGRSMDSHSSRVRPVDDQDFPAFPMSTVPVLEQTGPTGPRGSLLKGSHESGTLSAHTLSFSIDSARIGSQSDHQMMSGSEVSGAGGSGAATACVSDVSQHGSQQSRVPKSRAGSMASYASGNALSSSENRSKGHLGSRTGSVISTSGESHAHSSTTPSVVDLGELKAHGGNEEGVFRGIDRSRDGGSHPSCSSEGIELFARQRGAGSSSFKGAPDSRRKDSTQLQELTSDDVEGDTGRGVFERRGLPRFINSETIPESPTSKDMDTPKSSRNNGGLPNEADASVIMSAGAPRSSGPKALMPPPARISGFEATRRDSMHFDKMLMKAQSPARRGGLPHEAANIAKSPPRSRKGPPPSIASRWLPSSPLSRQNQVWVQTQDSIPEVSPTSPVTPLNLGLGKYTWARRNSLAQLNFSQTMDEHSPTLAPRQRKEKLASVDELDERTHFGPHCGEEFTTNPLHPISSLDHLFAQACVAHHLLLDKAYSLAKQTDGKFPVRGRGFSLKVSSTEDFRFGEVKSVHRCMSKVLMSFGGDASKLCDICRQIIVYDDLAGISTCLSILLHDPGVEVVRVKDRMSSNTTVKWLSTGYRFIAVNLRLRTVEAGSLCIDNHVVELILVHSALQELQSREAHKRYIIFRSMRTSMKRCIAISLLHRILEMMFPLGDKEDQLLLSQSKQGQVHDTTGDRNDTVIDVRGDSNGETGKDDTKGGTFVHAAQNEGGADTDIEICEVGDDKEEAGTMDKKLKDSHHSEGSSSQAIPDLPEWISEQHEVIGGGRVRSGEGNGFALFGEDLQDVLEYYTRVATSGLSAFFDLSWQETSDAGSQGASAGSVAFFSARPVVAAMQKTPFSIIVAAFAVASFAALASSFLSLNDWPIYKHYRFTPLQTKSGRLSNISVAQTMSSFGVIDMIGCPASNDTRPLNFRSAVFDVSQSTGGHHVLSYAEPTLARGWFLKTSTGQGTQDEDPVRFEVHGSNDLRSWVLIGRPRWLAFSIHGYAFFLDAIEAFQDRDAVTVYDPGVNMGWILYRIISKAIFAAGLLASSLVGLYRKGYAARYILITTTSGALFCMLWSAGFYMIFGLWENAVQVFIACIAFMFLSLGLIFERWFLRLFAVGGVIDILATVLAFSMARASLAPESEDVEFTQAAESYVGLCICILIVFVFIMRWRSLRSALNMIKADQQRYDALWQEVLVCDIGCLQNLKNVIRMVGLDSTSACRQYQRKRGVRGKLGQGSRQQPPDLLLDSLGFCTLPGSIDLQAPVTSLDQLYACASVANAVVLERVQKWALASNGMFPLRAENERPGGDKHPEFARWADIKGTPSEDRVRWSFLKKIHRASEKIIRSLGNDPSYLLDVCRHQIVFERPQDLTMCLGQIVLDDECRIERVKNRLSPEYDSKITAGYRDVAVNFRVVNHATMALGVEMHVVEIQLVLKSFAQFRGMDGHKRYIQFRNARGE